MGPWRAAGSRRGGGLPFLLPVILAVAIDTATTWSLAVGAAIGLIVVTLAGTFTRFRKRSPVLRPMQLPPITAEFVGRDGELAEIREQLLGSGRRPRVVVLHGPAGIGKSTLAVVAARRLSEHFAQGVLYARLSDYENPESAMEAVRHSFRAAGVDRVRSPLSRRPGYLMVFDDVPNAAWVEPLLPSHRRDRVIITARIQPQLDGDVRLLPVGALPREDALKLLGHEIGESRVLKDQAAAITIVDISKGFPLAIKLAAAPIANRHDYELNHLVRRLGWTDSPVDGSRDEEASALDVSVSLLSDQERDALLALGLRREDVFAPWMLEAMLEVGPETAIRISDQLAESRFVERVSTDAAGIFEYRLHENVMLYAGAMADERLSESRRQELLDNLRRRENTRRDETEPHGLRIRAFDSYLVGDLALAMRTAREAVGLSLDLERSADVGRGLALLAEINAELGDFAAARQLVDQVDKSDRKARVRALRTRGKIHRRLRQAGQAADCLDEALEGSRRLGDRLEEIRTLREKSVALSLTSGELGLETIDRALEMCRPGPDENDLRSGLLWARARAFSALDRWDNAAASLAEARRYAMSGHRQTLWLAWIRLQQAIVGLEQSSMPSALINAQSTAREALRIFVRMRHRYGTAESRLVVGKAMYLNGDAKTAVLVIGEAVETFHNCGDQWMEAESTRWLALAVAGRADVDDDRASELLLARAEQGFGSLHDEVSLERIRRTRAQLNRAAPDSGRQSR